MMTEEIFSPNYPKTPRIRLILALSSNSGKLLLNLQSKNTSTIANGILWGLFALVLLYFKFSYHELWKDEWQAWLVARDLSWTALPGFLYYEGHPALWYFYLKVWTLFSSSFDEAFLLQLCHSIPVLVSAYLLVFRFNFSLLLKAGILLSYHFCFEYGIVNRGYTLVILLGFAAALSLRSPEKNSGRLAIILFLLCQTEVYGLLMSGAIVLYLMLNTYFEEGKLQQVFHSGLIRRVVLAVGLGLVVFVATVYPRGEEEDLSRAYLEAPFSAEVIAKAFQGGLANTYTIGLLPDTNISGTSALGILLSLLVLAALISLFWADKKVLYTFLAFKLVFLFFLISIYTGGVRQWGMAFIFFIICLQLWTYSSPKVKTYQALIVGLILTTQMVHNGRAIYKDFHSPFSNALYAGAFIKEKVPDQVPIVAINKFEAAPVVGYAGRPFYELPEGKPFTFFKWLEKVYLPPEIELKLFAEYKKSKGLVLVSPSKLDAQRYPKAKLWKAFDRYSFKNEQYYLYLFEW